MIPKSLSASAALTFEGCPARFKAEYIDRTPSQDNVAAARGSAVHAALEMFIQQGLHLRDWPDIMVREKAMHVIWDAVYWDFFDDKSQYAEGWKMLNRWLQRTDWDGRHVLSSESKEHFDIPAVVDGQKVRIPFNYIMDRFDQLDNGDLEVVDYKTIVQPVQPDELKHKIQPRAYSLAARIKRPDVLRVWVTYDLLRYDQVSTAFTREDDIETWEYLKALTKRIIDSDGTEEKLCPECRFCVRKYECETLKKNIVGGGIMRYATKEEIANRRAEAEMALHALQTTVAELDEALFAALEAEEIFEFSTDKVDVGITAQSRRHADSERVAAILGPEIMVKYGKVGVGDLDDIMKVEELTDNQKSQLKQCIRKQTGTPRIKTKLKSIFEEDD